MRQPETLNVRAVVGDLEIAEQLRLAMASLQSVNLEVLVGPLEQHVSKLIGLPSNHVLLLEVNFSNYWELNIVHNLVAQIGDDTAIVLTGKRPHLGDMRRMLRIGVFDYLPQPFLRRDIRNLVRQAQRHFLERAGPPAARVFSFVKASGGAGATTLAIEAAIAVHATSNFAPDNCVCLADLDVYHGNISTYLDLGEDLDVGALIGSLGRLDAALVRSMTTQHADGLDVLALSASSFGLDEAAMARALTRLVGELRGAYEHVVFDLPSLYSEWVAEALSQSDVVYVVTQPSRPALLRTRSLVATLSQVIGPGTRLQLVLNRARAKASLRREAEKVLGESVDYVVPSDWSLAREASDRGLPVSQLRPNSGIQSAVRDMMEQNLRSAVTTSAS